MTGYEYLKGERRLTEETIRTFHLGWEDIKGSIYMDADFPGELELTDPRFRDSALFPIFNMHNRYIATSGRALNNLEFRAKYINTVYDKAEHCYGFNVTWREVDRTKKVYIVEGNVDLLQMYQSGIRNSVGMLGSNLSATQIALLTRFANEIVLVPDGDDAGRKVLSKLRGWAPSKFPKTKFLCVELPGGYDPDTFLKEKGPDALKHLERSLLITKNDRTLERPNVIKHQ